MNQEMILILDFGGQYNQLIARRVREHHVYCEIMPWKKSLEEIKAKNPKGIIFTGGPNSVYDDASPKVDPALFSLGVPILGICYGCQLMAYTLGGKVGHAAELSEYGKAEVAFDTTSKLLKGIGANEICWMSHTDYVTELPEGFRIIGKTPTCPAAAIECEAKGFYGVQFHPEVNHTPKGSALIKNFLFEVCGCKGDWTMTNYIEDQIKKIREQVGDGKALCALSGGVDSSVVAALVSKAIGKQLTCVFVDHGLMRKNEGDEVEQIFDGYFDSHFVRANAQERFLSKLKGVTDPEQKRKIIGAEFIRVFEEEARKLEGIEFLGQGTIYPDIIESGTKTVKVIKSHHNVGGLPEDLNFALVEPLKMLFKDEVRACGKALGLPDSMVYRQPFPGPGLGVRCLGAITRDRLEAVRESDAILREEFAKNGLEGKVWQYFTAIPNLKSVGVKDNKRVDEWCAIIRAVNTIDAMTATVENVPFELLQHITDRITHEVKGINRVLFDLTPKPTGTIEWE